MFSTGKTSPNPAGAVDAPIAGLLAFERVWSGTTHREGSDA